MKVGSTLRAVSLLTLFSAWSYAATLNINLLSSLLNANRGQTVTFSGSITNTTASPVALTSDALNIAAPLVGDDIKFFLNTPATLAGGASTAVVQLFDILVGPATPFGTYAGTFTILSGAGTNLGSATFAVNVVPEPVSLSLVGMALAALTMRRVRTRKA